MWVLWCLVVCVVSAAPLSAQGADWRVEAGVTFSHFQQQVKQEVGDKRGDRLVDETQLGLYLSGTYRLHDNIAVGLFLEADRGNRHNARFAGFDEEGTTQIDNLVGGHYTEFWFGPLVQFRWRQLFLDAGYGLVGIRSDDARTDLSSTTGDTESALTTHPLIAGLIAIGANIPIVGRLDAVLKAEYRFRYYTGRDGNPLAGDIEHGTQSIAPVLGVAYRF